MREPTLSNTLSKVESDLISRQEACNALNNIEVRADDTSYDFYRKALKALTGLASAQQEPLIDKDKYEYHYDHTDCIWYRPEARNRCPVTCAQYRDGWNDAMNYIFRDGNGYRPYRMDQQYGE